MSATDALPARRDRASTRTGSATARGRGQHRATGPRRGRPGVEAGHRRLRLLDLPAQRHRDVLRLLRGLRRAADGDGRRPDRARAVRPDAASRSRPPACWPRASPAGCRRSPTSARNQLWTQVCAAGHRACSAWRSCCSKRASSPAMVAARRRPAAQRLPVVLLRLVGCHGLHVSAGLLWLGTMMAQVFVKGFRPTSCAGCSASICSGTRSTSSGSRCSRSSI